jgi:hypothetical protein
VLGKGFIVTTEQAKTLISNDKRNKDVLFPYLNGEDLNNNPQQQPSRWVINFFDWSEEKARTYPNCFEIVERLVKPERQRWKVDEKGNEIVGTYALRNVRAQKWWHHAERAQKLYETISKLDQVMVIAQVSKTSAFNFTTPDKVLDAKLNVFALQDYMSFLLLQSNFHIQWAWKYSSTMKTDLSYAPTQVFETFPFPQNLSAQQKEKLEQIGEKYYGHRKRLMSLLKIGLTKTYNLFHSDALTANSINTKDKQIVFLQRHLEEIANAVSFEEAKKDILKLRELHEQIDIAVLDAYGWNDIDLKHDFYQVDYLSEKDRIRFTINPNARKEILKRLLKLNHSLYNAEADGNFLQKKSKTSKSLKTIDLFPEL